MANDGHRFPPGSEALTGARFEIVSRPVTGMPERVVAHYESFDKAEAALARYVRTYSPPDGSLWVREVVNDG